MIMIWLKKLRLAVHHIRMLPLIAFGSIDKLDAAIDKMESLQKDIDKRKSNV
jgi:hypothetical protein